MPEGRARPVLQPAGAECRGQRAAGKVIGAKRRVRPRTLDPLVDLAARRGLFVDQHGLETELGGEYRSRHAGRTAADDREFDAHRAVVSTLRARIWRRIRIPGRASTIQLCRFGMPSISARQSKQTPIMQ